MHLAKVLLFFLTTCLASADEVPKTSIRLDGNSGTDQFYQSLLGAEFQLNPEVRLQVAAGTTKVGQVKSSGEAQLGVSVHHNQNNDSSFGVNLTTFEDGLKSRSLRIGHIVNVAPLWEGDHRSDLILELQTALYLQSAGETRFRQNGLTLGFDQEFLDGGVVGVLWTQYFFSQRDQNLRGALSYFQSFEQSPVLRALGGLLTSTQVAHIGYSFFEDHFFDLSIGKSVPLDGALDEVTFSSLRWSWIISRRWSLSLEGTTNRVNTQLYRSGGFSLRCGI